MALFALGKIWFLEAGRLKNKVFVASLPPGWVESPDLAHLSHLPSLSHFTQLFLRSAPRLLMPWAIYAGRASNALAGLPSCQNRVGVMHTPCVQGGKGCIIAARWPRWFMLCRVTQKLFQPPTNIIPTSYFVTRGQPSPWDTSAVIWKCKIWLMFQISNFG